MLSDSIVNASSPNASKDFGKKKRANRSAKLKQCKLDARREQWLSQVKNKGLEEEVIGTRKKDPVLKDLEEIHRDNGSELSRVNSTTSSLSGVNDSGSSSSSSSSSSSFSSGGSFSGSVTEEDVGGGGCDHDDNDDDDDGCLDDWEVMADALADALTKEKQGHTQDADLSGNNESGSQRQVVESQLGSAGMSSKGVEKEKRKAWRPDDASRPQSLPNLSKQRSFPADLERRSCHVVNNPWVRCSVPTSCPICCEDLDLTDSNFLPCLCGFRLCLFCHKRILEEDGRCPGCRKPYAADTVEKKASVAGGGQTIRLARSCSMFPRV